MDTYIKQVSPVEYEYELTASNEDLSPRIEEALRAQRGKVALKGFRPGKVPAGLVKKMYGRAIAYEVVEQVIQEHFNEEVIGSEEHRVLGQPKMTELEYEPEGDLRAVIRFGVRPEFELADLSGHSVTKLVHPVADEDVEAEIERLRHKEGELVASDEAAGEEDYVVADVQQLDPDTGTPIIGRRDEDATIYLNDPRMPDEFKAGLLGKKAGDEARIEIVHEEAHEEDEAEVAQLESSLLVLPGQPEKPPAHHRHVHRYQLHVKEVKRRQLPEVDEAFIERVSRGRAKELDALRAEIRKELDDLWSRRSRELLEGRIIEKMIELHDVPVPESLRDVVLDSFVEDVRRRNEGHLPEGFDEAAFREQNAGEAERQARWMLIRSKLVEEEGLEVTEEDLHRHFEQVAEGAEFTADQFRQYYRTVPGLLDQLKERLLGEKVFDTLISRLQIVEKSREDFVKEQGGEEDDEGEKV